MRNSERTAALKKANDEIEIVKCRTSERAAKRSIQQKNTHEEDSAEDEESSSSSDGSTSRSVTPVPQQRAIARRGKRFRRKNHHQKAACKLQYEYASHSKELHGFAIFGVQFNPYIPQDETPVFATVGANRATIYKCERDGSMTLVQCYCDPDPEENFYTCVWGYEEFGTSILAVAGHRGVIRIFMPSQAASIKNFIGHGNAINELKFHPKDPNLLLSMSKDHALRLWNIKTEQCVIIFGGVEGHRDEVLSADFNLDGNLIMSGGMDHSLKMWRIDTPRIQKNIKDSYFKQQGTSFQTICQHYPDFSTRDIHRNYVDCVRWMGEFLVTKACENSIVIWKPGRIDTNEIKPSESRVSVVHKLDFKDCNIWFVRFSMDYWQKILALGNKFGVLYVWDLDVNDPALATYSLLTHAKCNSAIRQTAVTFNGEMIVAVCDDGTIWRWDRLADKNGGC